MYGIDFENVGEHRGKRLKIKDQTGDKINWKMLVLIS